jgi:hypothetical protein
MTRLRPSFPRPTCRGGRVTTIRLAPLTILYGKSGLGKAVVTGGVVPIAAGRVFPSCLSAGGFSTGRNPPWIRLCGAQSGDRSRWIVRASQMKVLGVRAPRRSRDLEHRQLLLMPVLVFDQFEELPRSGATGANPPPLDDPTDLMKPNPGRAGERRRSRKDLGWICSPNVIVSCRPSERITR